MSCCDEQKSMAGGSGKSSDTPLVPSPRPKSGPTFSPEEEESMEQERASMQEEAERALEVIKQLRRNKKG